MHESHQQLLDLYSQVQHHVYYKIYSPGWQSYAWEKTYYQCIRNKCSSCEPILYHLRQSMDKLNLL